MDSLKRLEDTAAEILARRDSSEWTADDQAALDQWLNAATAHRVAYLRLEAAWEEARRLRALGAGRPPGSVPPPGEWRDSPFFERGGRSAGVTSESRAGFADGSREADSESALVVSAAAWTSRIVSRGDSKPIRRWGFALAASLLLAVSAGAWFALHPEGNRYAAAVGDVVSVPLKDGSEVTLNTASEVHVDLTPTERRINLDRGEAFFAVAKDPKRPFVVRAAGKRITAVGTQFSVRIQGDDVQVAVAEGTVRIDSATEPSPKVLLGSSSASQGSRQGEPGEIFLSAGGIASATDGGVVVREESVATVEANLSWRQGYLTFHDTALADAVAEFNRYNAHQIVIEDPQIAAIHISGTFRALNSDAFIRVLDEGFSIHARPDRDRTILTRE